MAYSPVFQTLHDETKPVGNLGRGTHHSILRAVTWHDTLLRPLPHASFLDFAVIGDEDHDTRIIEAIEQLYFEGLLAPVRLIGERKGFLTVLLAPEFLEDSTSREIDSYRRRLKDGEQRSVAGDLWAVEMDTIPGNLSIIQDAMEKVATYTACLMMLWELGVKPASAGSRAGELPSLQSS
jgi:hypothetical protein